MSVEPSWPLSPLPMRSLLTRWQRLVARVYDPYRPERHYMRGPGPKWHARRQAGVGAMLKHP